MLSAFKYRIYPNKEQEKLLNSSLLSLCNLYNALKAGARRRYKEEHKSTSLYILRKIALDIRKQRTKEHT
jgi:transposase